jgi:biopolymer transport protein ExbD
MIDFNRPRPVTNDLNMISMMDIIFNLLLFFLLTAVFADPGISVDLPDAQTGTFQDAPQETTLTITRLGEIYLNAQPVTLPDLPGRLAELFAQRSERQVIIKADQEVAVGLFVRVLDLAKAAGSETFVISSELPSPEAASK